MKIETIDDLRQYNREKQAVYNRRRTEAGYQRATIWLSRSLLETLRQEGKQTSRTLQQVIADKLSEQTPITT